MSNFGIEIRRDAAILTAMADLLSWLEEEKDEGDAAYRSPHFLAEYLAAVADPSGLNIRGLVPLLLGDLEDVEKEFALWRAEPQDEAPF